MTRVLLDTMLGRLATYLRMCGYDAEYSLDVGLEHDDAILKRANHEDRVLVTRDRELADRAENTILLETLDLTDQLDELSAAGFEFELPDRPQRCSICNVELTSVPPEQTTPPYAPDAGTESVWRCPDCGQHFWKGSHWDNVATRLSKVD